MPRASELWSKVEHTLQQCSSCLSADVFADNEHTSSASPHLHTYATPTMSHQATTAEGTHIPRAEYPRPDFDRSSRSPESWLSLNGPWSFAFDDADEGLDFGWYKRHAGDNDWPHSKITVPFAFQTEASGPVYTKDRHEILWYAKDVPWDINLDSADGSELLLKLGNVDYECIVWINGQQVGQHRGVHSSFEVDITRAVADTTKFGENFTITVRVVDRIPDKTQPRGKQYWKAKPEGIYYTPSSGIFGVVWLERVARTRIQQAKIVPDIDAGTLNIHVTVKDLQRVANKNVRFAATASLAGREITADQVDVSLDTFTADVTLKLATGVKADFSTSALETIQEPLPPGLFTAHQLQLAVQDDGIAFWSPEHPVLYDVELSLLDKDDGRIDRVKTQAGMRKVSISNGLFELNNKPYFQRLVLDQGYWPKSGLTAPDDAAFVKDIVAMKELGLNGARKHQKNEDPRWLYWADRLGFLVWSEFANAQDFSPEYVDRFTAEWVETLHRDLNHPSIVVWTPVNESWGVPDLPKSQTQRDHLRSIYWLTKTIDPTRLVVDNDGWEHVVTDLITTHDYDAAAALAVTLSTKEGSLSNQGDKHDKVIALEKGTYTGQPIILSEFGGIKLGGGDTVVNNQIAVGGSEDWGYHTARNADEFVKMVSGLIDAVIASPYVQGYCYTQLADVEQEVNGLLTVDRQFKVKPEVLRPVLAKKSRWD